VPATGYVTLDNHGHINNIILTNQGSGYINIPKITLNDNLIKAIVTPDISNSILTSLSIVNSGRGYTTNPNIKFKYNDIIQTIAKATINSKYQVNSIEIIQDSTDISYSSINISSPDATMAIATYSLDKVSENHYNLKFSIDNGGSGYLSPPNVDLSYNKSTAIIESCQISEGTIIGINLLNSGSGYLEPPIVTIAPPSDTNKNVIAKGKANINDFKVQSITLINKGNGYLKEPTITISPPNAETAKANAIIMNRQVTRIEISKIGSGYINPPTVTISKPNNGETATAYATISNGSITSIIIQQKGSGYVKPPTITISSPETTNASASCTIKDGNVNIIIIENPGQGYVTQPIITFTSPSINATAVAILDASGYVNAIEVTNPGAGYKLNPEIKISKPENIILTSMIKNSKVVDIRVVYPPIIKSIGFLDNNSTINISPPHTEQATGILEIKDSKLKATISNHGYGYVSKPIVTLVPINNNFRFPYVTLNVLNGNVSSYLIHDEGKGLANSIIAIIDNPENTLCHKSAKLECVLSQNIPYSTIVHDGYGYTEDYKVSLYNNTLGTDISFGCIMEPRNSIIGLDLNNNGQGYIKPPEIKIIDQYGTFNTFPINHKTISKSFDKVYGREQFNFGIENLQIDTETSKTNPSEIFKISNYSLAPRRNDGTQIWHISNNDFQSYPIHIHQTNVQIINRIGKDGMIYEPCPEEYGWRETIQCNPLQYVVLAIRPIGVGIPFGLLDSKHDNTNFGWESEWTSSSLGYKDNGLLHSIVVHADYIIPDIPINFKATKLMSNIISLEWDIPNTYSYLKYNKKAITSIKLNKYNINSANLLEQFIYNAGTTSFKDTNISSNKFYTYELIFINQAGESLPATLNI